MINSYTTVLIIMYSLPKFIDLTIDEYLQFDLESMVPHEYIAGQVYPVLKKSHHVKIIAENIFSRLRTQLHGKQCRVFSSDMKIRIEPINVFYYPEVFVVCDSQDKEKFFKTRPCVIVEILSPNTERINRNEKLLNYRQLSSLQEYILVSQSEIKVDIYRKINQNNWLLETFTENSTLKLQSVDVEITMAEMYEDVIL